MIDLGVMLFFLNELPGAPELRQECSVTGRPGLNRCGLVMPVERLLHAVLVSGDIRRAHRHPELAAACVKDAIRTLYNAEIGPHRGSGFRFDAEYT